MLLDNAFEVFMSVEDDRQELWFMPLVVYNTGRNFLVYHIGSSEPSEYVEYA